MKMQKIVLIYETINQSNKIILFSITVRIKLEICLDFHQESIRTLKNDKKQKLRKIKNWTNKNVS